MGIIIKSKAKEGSLMCEHVWEKQEIGVIGTGWFEEVCVKCGVWRVFSDRNKKTEVKKCP